MLIIVYAVHAPYKSLLAMFVVLTTRGEHVKMVQQVELGMYSGLDGKRWISQQRRSHLRRRLETRATCTNRLGFRSAKCHTYCESGDSAIVSSVTRNFRWIFRFPRRRVSFGKGGLSQNLVAPPFRLNDTLSYLERTYVSGSSSRDKSDLRQVHPNRRSSGFSLCLHAGFEAS